METTEVSVAALNPGDVVAFDPVEPVWVTVLKVQADRYGFDVLYQFNDGDPHWRGFDEGDRVAVRL